MNQVELSDYEQRQQNFARVRALIMQILDAEPGLTVEQITERFGARFHFFPRIDNRLRELREMDWVRSDRGSDNRLHWRPMG
jgi:hypothetical protein